MNRDTSRLCFVVPAWRSERYLDDCLRAIGAARGSGDRLVVAFDGRCSDREREIAARHGAEIIVLPVNRGPAAARNAAVRQVDADVVFFVDVDVRIVADAVVNARRALATADAVVGRYTPRPAAPGRLSLLKNLQHSYVHTAHAGEAATFWTGCGALRRDVYLAVDGLDEDLRYCEDIALGGKLHAAGYRIVIDPTVAGAHAKTYSLRGWVRNELVERAIPWSRLLLAGRAARGQLNAGPQGLLSMLATAVTVGSLLAAPVLPAALLVTVGGVGSLVALNAGLLRFANRYAGIAATVGLVPVLLGHYCLGAVGAAVAVLTGGGRMIAPGS
jgi:GT2 family glycosyltransferase